MTSNADDPGLDVTWLRAQLTPLADPKRAQSMTAYLKDQFPFLGVGAPERRSAQRPLLGLVNPRNPAVPTSAVLDFADACWAEAEREFQYVAVDLLRKCARLLGPDDLDRIEHLIRAKSWWDTVDGLAAWVVGPLVATNRSLVTTVDRWIGDDDLWIARTAILHQLSYKEATDRDRLFSYVLTRSDDPDFFIRKAAGWALRQYARTDPQAVAEFVRLREDRLSALTIREATKHLNR